MSIVFSTSDEENTLTLENPLWGYVSTLKLPLWYSTRADGSIGVFDAGVAYDRCICKCIFQMNAEDAEDALLFFRDPALGRGNPLYLDLPTGGGFFPFGPDRGDYGRFIVQVINVKPSPQLMEPFRRFNISATLVYNYGPTPSWSIPTGDDTGNIQIGAITNLRYPESTFQSEANYAIQEQLLYTQAAGVVDLGQTADTWRTRFDLMGTRKTISRLIAYLRSTPRSPSTKSYASFTVTTQDNQFMFGAEQTAVGNHFAVILLTKDIEMTHINFNLYKVPLVFQLTAVL